MAISMCQQFAREYLGYISLFVSLTTSVVGLVLVLLVL